MSKITKLPDGSAFCTATIMPREEAMKLPLKKRQICFRISSEMYHAVFEAIGGASMCWKPETRQTSISVGASVSNCGGPVFQNRRRTRKEKKVI